MRWLAALATGAGRHGSQQRRNQFSVYRIQPYMSKPESDPEQDARPAEGVEEPRQLQQVVYDW